jgi:hypothetical protein
MIHVDLWDNTFDSFAVSRRSDCVACVQNKFEYLEGERAGVMTAFLCGRNAVQVNPGKGHALNLHGLAEKLHDVGEVSVNESLVTFSIGNYELTIFPDARAIVKGTEDAAIARSVRKIHWRLTFCVLGVKLQSQFPKRYARPDHKRQGRRCALRFRPGTASPRG